MEDARPAADDREEAPRILEARPSSNRPALETPTLGSSGVSGWRCGGYWGPRGRRCWRKTARSQAFRVRRSVRALAIILCV